MHVYICIVIVYLHRESSSNLSFGKEGEDSGRLYIYKYNTYYMYYIYVPMYAYKYGSYLLFGTGEKDWGRLYIYIYTYYVLYMCIHVCIQIYSGGVRVTRLLKNGKRLGQGGGLYMYIYVYILYVIVYYKEDVYTYRM